MRHRTFGGFIRPSKIWRRSRGDAAQLLVLYHQRPDEPALERSYAVLRALYAGSFVVARDLDVFR